MVPSQASTALPSICGPEHKQGFLKMPRRKKIRPDPVAGGRRAANKAQFDGTERNRASPQAICKLYKHINENQRVAIIDMGTGPFLDIKCGYLHNTAVTWFTRLYHSGRRGFVVPGRGFIPLTEESVHQMLGIPHGDIEVKYEADYEKEDDIAGSLFPVDGNRPKITTVATAIINYNEADDRFKQLWLIYIVSTVLAPTTDTRISNKCYPMLENINQANRLNLCKFVVDQLHEHLSKGKYTKGCLLYCMLRYLDALDCDGMELELPDTPYRVNAWSKTQVDVVAELDMLEHDPPSYGKFQLKEEFREEAAIRLGLFGAPGGFETWMKQNIHPNCSESDKLKATTFVCKFASGMGTLLSEFASGVDTLLTELVQGLTAPTTSNSTKRRSNKGTGIEESDDTSSEDSSSSESDHDTDEHDVDVERGKMKRITREEHIDRDIVESPVKAKGRDEAGGAENMINDPSQREMFIGDVDTTSHTDTLETENCDNTSSGHPYTQSDIKSPSGATSHLKLPSDSDMCNSDNNSPTDAVDSLISEGNSQQLEEEIRGSAAGLATRLCELKITRRSAETEQGSGSTHEQIKRIVAKELGLPKESCRQQCEERNANQNARNSDAHRIKQMPRRKHAECTQEAMDKDLTSQEVELGAHVSLKRKSTGPLKQPSPKRQGTRRSPRLARITSSNVSGAEGTPMDASRSPMEQGSSASSGSKTTGDVAKARRGNSRMRSLVKDGCSASTAIIVSPKVSLTTQPSKNIGESKSTAIVLSPAVDTNVHSGSGSFSSPIKLSPVAQNIQRRMTANGPRVQQNDDGSPAPIPKHVLDVITNLSESAKRLGLFQDDKYKSTAARGNPNKINAGSSSSRPRDNRPGAFTPPSFSLGLSPNPPDPSEEGNKEAQHPNAGEPLEVVPLSWAKPPGAKNVPQTFEYPLSEKLKAFLATGDLDEIDEELAVELDDYETQLQVFFDKKRAAGAAAAAARSNAIQDEFGVQSVTPKPNPHKGRVKKKSRFQLSPYDDDIKVTGEQEDVYGKLMLSNKHHKNGNSKIKNVIIIKYEKSWVYTWDLADSTYITGELSANCAEVGVEYLQTTNKIEGKLILSHLVTKILLQGEHTKRIVTNIFERKQNFALSCQNLIMFPVIEEIGVSEVSGHHWYLLCINNTAQRFEALDSLRGKTNMGLIGHATAVMKRIKEAWKLYYHKSRVQIEDYKLEIIDVPKQRPNSVHCGFYMLESVEKWDGENVPQIRKEDIAKIKKVTANKWLSAPFNQNKKWKWQLDQNSF